VTLRTRLTAAFLAVVLGPVLLGAVFVGGTVATVGRDRSQHQLELAAGAVRSSVAALCQQLQASAEAVAWQPPEQRAALAAELAGRDLVTEVRIVGLGGAAGSGDPVETAGEAVPAPWADCDSPPAPRGGAPPPPKAGVPDKAAGTTRYEAICARVAMPDGDGEVWALARLDTALVERLAAAAGADVTLVGADPSGPVFSTDETAESTVEAARSLAPGVAGESADGRWVRRLDPADGQPLPLVLSTPRTHLRGLYALLTGLVVLAGLLAVVAAWRLARSTTEPLAELAAAADQVADGDLGVRVPVRGGDEAGRLATTFNRMTHRMQSYVQALTASRDQLRRQLGVLGDTLSSTHDLDRILRVILRTAVAATGAGSGAVLLIDEERGVLVGHTTTRTEDGEASLTVPLGGGLLGAVAVTGEPRRGRVGDDGPVLDRAEPACQTYVVVPISAPGGLGVGLAGEVQAAPWPAPPTVRGVLALYDRLGGDEFDDTDLVTLRTFAGQAAVAVDNVRTHEEAQRLSMTDPLTGLWNYRSLKESLHREVERATRYRHPLAVLTLDLDRFKDINDAYGHPAGDAVLAEFAVRLRSAIREVDLAFRHGGEEFVMLLPETDGHGARALAQRLGAAVRDDPVVIAARRGGEVASAAVLAGLDAGQVPVRVTVSIGIAVFPDHALNPDGLLDAADDALYAAKAAGRDTYRVAPELAGVVEAGAQRGSRRGGERPAAAVAELAVRARARIPVDDLPHAGGGGDDVASAPDGEPDRAPDRAPDQGERSGGAQPPRQTRGR
jgi:diguanylate cyclase (GGDEF)-like protein